MRSPLWESAYICNQASTRFQVEICVNSSNQRRNWKWSASSLIYIPSFWNTLFSWGTSKKKSACFSFKFQPFAGVVEYKEHRNLNHCRKSVAHRFKKDSSRRKLKLKLPSLVCWGVGGPLMSVLEVGSIVGICRALRKNWSIKPLEKLFISVLWEIILTKSLCTSENSNKEFTQGEKSRSSLTSLCNWMVNSDWPGSRMLVFFPFFPLCLFFLFSFFFFSLFCRWMVNLDRAGSRMSATGKSKLDSRQLLTLD